MGMMEKVEPMMSRAIASDFTAGVVRAINFREQL